MTWLDRCMSLIEGTKSVRIVDGPSTLGYELVFHELAITRNRILFISLEPNCSSIGIANELVDGLSHAGIARFGRGMPCSYVLRQLPGLASPRHPVLILITGGQHAVDSCHALVRTCERHYGAIRAVVAGYGSSAWSEFVSVQPVSRIVAQSQFLMAPREATQWLSENAYPEQEVGVVASPIAYVDLLNSVKHFGVDSVQSLDGTATQTTHWPTSRHSKVIQARGVQAYSSVGSLYSVPVGATTQGPLTNDYLDDLGEDLLRRGEPEALLEAATEILEVEPGHSRAMYWWFQAQVALGNHRSAAVRVRKFLQGHEDDAPELLAAYASSLRPSGALRLAERAARARKCAETVAAEGFLRALDGQVMDGIGLLRDAFNTYTSNGHVHRATLVSNSIGAAYIQIGEYTRGYYWAKRSWGEISAQAIPEELLRLSTQNLLAYSLLLLGRSNEGLRILEDVHLDPLNRTRIPPTLEGLVTTFGDYAIVRSEYSTALAYYRLAYNAFSSTLPGFASLPYVRCLVRMNRIKDADAIVKVARALVTNEQTREQVLLDVASLLVAQANGKDITRFATSILSTSVAQSDAQIVAETVLALAQNHLRQGQPDQALRIMQESKSYFSELGDTGWKLFTPTGASPSELAQLVEGDDSEWTTIQVLGGQTILKNGQVVPLPLRTAELATILAFSPQGKRSPSLLHDLLGDEGKVGTLKSIISRAKHLVPILSGPYKLGSNCDIDATRLEELLQVGEVSRAVELYQGPLLQQSDAPGIVRLRATLEEEIRQAVLQSSDPDLIIQLAKKLSEDLELWEAAYDNLPNNDPRIPLVQAHIRTIRSEWEL